MQLKDYLFSEIEREIERSRRALEQVPAGQYDWKPHEKSMPLGYLSTLVAMMPAWIEMAITKDELDLSSGQRPSILVTTRDLLQMNEESAAKGKEALRNTTDAHLMTPWKLLVAGKVVMETPRQIVIADTFGHMAHHRGQLTVYLRLLGAPVPAIYGPSADDNSF